MSSLGKAGEVEGLHSLGACENNHRVETAGWWQNHEVYKDYKFALVIENTLEPGYITEKLAVVIAAGAMPIYLGDDYAANMIFGSHTFISVRDFTAKDIGNVGQLSHQETWEDVTKRIAEVVTSEKKLQAYFRMKQEANPQPPATYLAQGVFPPSCAALSANPQHSTPDSVMLQRAMKVLKRAVKGV